MWDLESDSADPEIAQPIQISALAIEPIHLKVIPNSEFNMMCKPDGFDDADYLNDARQSTYQFHADNKGISLEEMLERVRNYPSIKLVFKQFVDYVRSYADKPGSTGFFQAPISVGYNNIAFDEPIAKVLCKKYNVLFKGEPSLFFWRDSVDIKNMMFTWFEGASDGPKNYKMDTLRPMFKINASLANAHDGLQDCRDEAEMFVRLLTVNRAVYKKIAWPWKQ